MSSTMILTLVVGIVFALMNLTTTSQWVNWSSWITVKQWPMKSRWYSLTLVLSPVSLLVKIWSSDNPSPRHTLQRGLGDDLGGDFENDSTRTREWSCRGLGSGSKKNHRSSWWGIWVRFNEKSRTTRTWERHDEDLWMTLARTLRVVRRGLESDSTKIRETMGKTLTRKWAMNFRIKLTKNGHNKIIRKRIRNFS